MPNIFKIKRGNFATMPVMQDGEIAFCRDTEQFFIGKNTAKVELSTVHQLTHARAGTVHTLTGAMPTTGFATIRFKATAAFVAGDTFKVGAVVYAAKPVGEELALPDKAFVSGDVVTAEADIVGKKINFKLGSGGASVPKEFGEGSDGDLIITSGQTVTLPVVNNGIVIKQYKSIRIDAGGILTTSAPNVGLIIKCKGDCKIDGVIDQSGKGFADGTSNYPYVAGLVGGSGGKGGNGGKGGHERGREGAAGGLATTGKTFCGTPSGYGGGAGGGGASTIGSATQIVAPQAGSRDVGGIGAYWTGRQNNVDTWGRGGNGGNGGAIAYGGGLVYLFCGGELTVTGQIKANGSSGGSGSVGGYGLEAGTNAHGFGGGGGGGSGGGIIYVCHNASYLNTGSLSVSGGSGGNGGSAGGGFPTNSNPPIAGTNGSAGAIGATKVIKFVKG